MEGDPTPFEELSKRRDELEGELADIDNEMKERIKETRALPGDVGLLIDALDRLFYSPDPNSATGYWRKQKYEEEAELYHAGCKFDHYEATIEMAVEHGCLRVASFLASRGEGTFEARYGHNPPWEHPVYSEYY
jgi:hypothetical protein